MGNFQTLKNQAAVIRDEQNDYKNTATRVGSMFVRLLEQLEKALPDENVKPDTLSVEATGTSYILKFTTVDSDGTTKDRELSLPLASDDKAGIMSPALMKGIKDQISKLDKVYITTLDITTLTNGAAVTSEQQTEVTNIFGTDKPVICPTAGLYSLNTEDIWTKYILCEKDGTLYGAAIEGTNWFTYQYDIRNKAFSVGYVECATAASTASKTITVTGMNALSTGIRLLVKMTNNNTASNTTLNINSLGAKPLYYNNVRVSGDNAWEAGEVIEVYYDGTNFYSSNVLGGSGDGGNMILDWNTNIASTRKQVKDKDRKAGMQISYLDPDNGWVNEQYVGADFTDTEWIKDSNWEKIPNQTQISDLASETVSAYVYSIIDSEGKVLVGIMADGDVVFGCGIPSYIKNKCMAAIEYLQDNDIQSGFDYTELTLSADNKILSYRTKDGIKHEVLFEADKFILSKKNAKQISSALQNIGFFDHNDLSSYESAQLPIPECAIVNLTNIDNIPQTKNTNAKSYLEYYDGFGNYFKKCTILNAQGNSSMQDIKKNMSIDICNDYWIGNDTFKIRFGDWVEQDSFHLKAYYQDWSKCTGITCYEICEQQDLSKGIMKDRPWKKALIKDITGDFDLRLRLDTGAKCHPMGFPCIVYLNGDFYGIYQWQLKKHRDNYNMEKDIPENIHIEGDTSGIWSGNINWSAFEIRNPKDLFYKEAHNGSWVYDADIATAEIADAEQIDAWIASSMLPDGSSFDPESKDGKKILTNMKNTKKVKQYIKDISEKMSLIDSTENEEEKKGLIDTYFDSDNLIDIVINIAFCQDHDWPINIQWTTWDGVKWFVNQYDMDRCMANGIYGEPVEVSSTSLIKGYSGYPLKYPDMYYKKEIKARWAELKDKGIFTLDNIMNILKKNMLRIGVSNYEMELEKFPPKRTDGQRGAVQRTLWEIYEYMEKALEVENNYINSL